MTSYNVQPIPVDLSSAGTSLAQKKHHPKDQYKSTNSNKYIGRGNGATGEYLRLSQAAGKPCNCGEYTEFDVVFISANGKRNGRMPPDLGEVFKAVQAKATFLTDARIRRPEGGNPYNIGEQEVADFLRQSGYRETNEFNNLVCRWLPQ